MADMLHDEGYRRRDAKHSRDQASKKHGPSRQPCHGSTLPTLGVKTHCTSYVDCQGRKLGFMSARSVHGFCRVAPVA